MSDYNRYVSHVRSRGTATNLNQRSHWAAALGGARKTMGSRVFIGRTPQEANRKRDDYERAADRAGL